MKKIIQFLPIAAACFLCTFSLAQSNNKQAAVFNHLAIYVVDMNRSGDFYMNIIGLDSIPEPFHDGKHIWLKTGAGNSLHIIQGAESKKEYYKGNHICFSVPSIEVFTAMLKKKGITFEDLAGTKNVVSSRPDGIKQLWLQDPDGYWIEINNAKE
jgi:lactoylglutathione lyase